MLPEPRRVGSRGRGPLVVYALADAPQLRTLVIQGCCSRQVAAAFHDLLCPLLEEDAEVFVRGSVPRIRRRSW